jgi:hypothetical protein
MRNTPAIFAAVAAVCLAGCTTTRTEVSREIVSTNGVRTVESTTTRANTFADAKNRLADFKATQSTKSQSIGIGEQTGESSSEIVGQFMNGIMMLGRLAAATQGVLLPAPSPVPVTVTNFVTVTRTNLVTKP